jgi:hypothetical protein
MCCGAALPSNQLVRDLGRWSTTHTPPLLGKRFGFGQIDVLGGPKLC